MESKSQSGKDSITEIKGYRNNELVTGANIPLPIGGKPILVNSKNFSIKPITDPSLLSFLFLFHPVEVNFALN